MCAGEGDEIDMKIRDVDRASTRDCDHVLRNYPHVLPTSRIQTSASVRWSEYNMMTAEAI